MPVTLTTLKRPRNEEFCKCLTCGVRGSHDIHWEGRQKHYRCQKCGFEFWVYIDAFGPQGKDEAVYHVRE